MIDEEDGEEEDVMDVGGIFECEEKSDSKMVGENELEEEIEDFLSAAERYKDSTSISANACRVAERYSLSR